MYVPHVVLCLPRLARPPALPLPHPLQQCDPHPQLSGQDVHLVARLDSLAIRLGGEVCEHPEVLDAAAVSDHAPIAACIRVRAPVPVAERPIPKDMFEAPQFKVFMERAIQAGPFDHLSPPSCPRLLQNVDA